MSQQAKAKWKLIFNIVSFVGFIVLIFALRKQIVESFNTIGQIKWGILLLLPVWQVLNYDAYARQNKGVFAILGKDIGYKFLYRLNLELNFVNHVLPSGGVSGFSYVGMRMKEKNVSAAQASIVQLLRFVLVFIAFQLLLFIALVLLSFSGQVNSLVLLIGGSVATLVFVGTIGTAYIVGSKKRINAFFGFFTQIANRVIHLFRPKNPETINVMRAREVFDELHDNYVVIKNNYRALRRPLFWSLVACTTEVLTVYTVYVAFGHWVNPGAVILAYAIANFAGILSVLPSGIGVYEAIMTAVLAIGGISAAISIPVTVMYRVLSMIIQLVPGYILYYRRMRSEKS